MSHALDRLVGLGSMFWLPLGPAHASVSPAEGGAAGALCLTGNHHPPQEKAQALLVRPMVQYRIIERDDLSHPFSPWHLELGTWKFHPTW